MVRYFSFGWVKIKPRKLSALWRKYPGRILLLLFCCVSSQAASAKDTLWLSVPFYSQNLVLSYEEIPEFPPRSLLFADQLIADYQYLKNLWQYQLLLNQLQESRSRLGLNDWLYYELIWYSSQHLFRDHQYYQRLLSWFLLSESGFDTRITYRGDQLFLYAYTDEGIFDTPIIKDEERNFVNLTSIHEPMDDIAEPLSLLPYQAMPYGRSFSFAIQSWPRLLPMPLAKKITFQWDGRQVDLELTIDQTIALFMEHYPIFSEQQYLEVPLSQTLAKSLIPQLKQMLEGKTEKESLEALVGFTRTAFAYKDDQDYFGKNKPMIADELFHYPYSDCEDRSALFFNLVRSLLDLPMIVIAYPNHLTIGVALEEAVGPAIQYQGKSYYICDPTGPSNSDVIGLVPAGYEEVSFEILGKYD